MYYQERDGVCVCELWRKVRLHRPVLWPPRSPDRTPADYYLWIHLKDTVYGEKINQLDEVWFLVELAATIRHVPGLYQPYGNYLRHSFQFCIQTEGDHFKHLVYTLLWTSAYYYVHIWHLVNKFPPEIRYFCHLIS